MLAKVKGRIGKLFSDFKPKKAALRLINAWLSVLIIEIFSIKAVFTSFDYLSTINVIGHIVFVAEFYVFYEILNRQKIDRILLMLLSFIYIMKAATGEKDVFFGAACCVVMACVIAYAYHEKLRVVLKKNTTIACFAVMGVFFALFTGIVTVQAYLNHWTQSYDFGIFSQIFYNMKETGLPYATCERDTLLNHFAVHFSPILYLILPFYFIFQTPITLLVAQSIIVPLGLIPLYLICKNHKLSDTATFIFGAVYTFMPSMAGACFYYFHENCFLPALILWFIYWMEKKDCIWQTAAALALLLLVKEDAAIYAASVALYFMLSKKNVKKGGIFSAASVVYFLLAVFIMNKVTGGLIANVHYENYMYNENAGLLNLPVSVILSPIYAIKESFELGKFQFIMQMMLPMAFLPVMIKKPSKIVLFVPLFLINIMTDYSFQFNIFFQYTFGTAVILIYLSILNYEDIKNRKFAEKVIIIALCSCLILFMQAWNYKFDAVKNFERNAHQREVLAQAEAVIPEDASVAASSSLLANVANRDVIYELDSTVNEAQYIYIDLRGSEDDFEILRPYANESFSPEFYYEHVAAVIKNNAYVPAQ